MDKSCLNCKFEPDWSAWVKEWCSPRIKAYGMCKFPIPTNGLPECDPSNDSRGKRDIIRYGDNSGVYHNCSVWAPKE